MLVYDKGSLAVLRVTRGLTLKDFAAKINLSPQHAGNLVRGKHIPGAAVLARVCNSFGVEPGYFFTTE